MQRLVYIIGSGRSGTTLLDIILGNGENCFSAGELNRIPIRSAIPPQRQNNSSTYKFWLGIKDSIENNSSKEINYQLLKIITSRNEYFLAPLLKYFQKKSHKSQYHEYNKTLYFELNKKINGQIIIESSKYPLRALNISTLLTNTKIDFIYLKKDPATVVRSFQKKGLEQPTKSYILANLYYFISNTYCSIVSFLLRNRGFNVIEINFENLIMDPENNLKKIGSKFNINYDHVIESIRLNERILVGNLFDGNRIRLNKTIAINKQSKYYNRFKDKLSRVINFPFI